MRLEPELVGSVAAVNDPRMYASGIVEGPRPSLDNFAGLHVEGDRGAAGVVGVSKRRSLGPLLLASAKEAVGADDPGLRTPGFGRTYIGWC